MNSTSIRQAVILAGGQGMRLRPITNTIPKPMVPIQGKPFLEHLVMLLRPQGISEVIMLLGYLPEKIQEYFGDGNRWGVSIQYSIGSVEDETGTRIRNARPFLDNRFLMLYCDNYWPAFNLSAMLKTHEESESLATLTVYTNRVPITRNNLEIGPDNLVKRYDRSRREEGLNAVDAGFFILERSCLNELPDHNFSFEDEVIPALIKQNKLGVFKTDHRYYSIGSIERLPIAEKFFQPRKILFLDRDGVINRKAEKGSYIRNWSEFEFLPGAVDALVKLSQLNYEFYLISNQAGIARGQMTRKDAENIHERLEQELGRNGVKINGIYFCPHAWDRGCGCRKPEPGMLFQAASEHAIDFRRAVFVGDDPRDEKAGLSVGCRTIMVSPQRGLAEALSQLS